MAKQARSLISISVNLMAVVDWFGRTKCNIAEQMVFDRLVEAIDPGSADFLLCAPPSSVERPHALRLKAKVSWIVEKFEFLSR